MPARRRRRVAGREQHHERTRSGHTPSSREENQRNSGSSRQQTLAQRARGAGSIAQLGGSWIAQTPHAIEAIIRRPRMSSFAAVLPL